jgi:hypothetical protein
MTFKKTAIIVLGFVLAAGTAGYAQAATSTPYLPYTGHGGLDIVTDQADPLTTGSISVEPGCNIHLPYTGHGGLEIVADCDQITTGSIKPASNPYLPYTGHGGLDIVE